MLVITHTIGEPIQIAGIHLSLVLIFVSIPKAYRPSSGPYVYPATLNTALIIIGLSISDILPLQLLNSLPLVYGYTYAVLAVKVGAFRQYLKYLHKKK